MHLVLVKGCFVRNKLIKAWEENGPEYYHEIQKQLLLVGADMLKPNGMMLFSTCTLSKLENEASIRFLLQNRPAMHLIDIKPYEGFNHGFVESKEDEEFHMDKAVRIWPHKMEGEGHFVALFQKDNDAEVQWH